jgi:hypothetical protein
MAFGDWLRRLKTRLVGGRSLPEGWTDDMTVPLPSGRTAADVVEFVLQAGLAGTPDDETERRLMAEFGFSPDDAALARDRAYGGLVRAATRNQANCPSRTNDPLAWESFQRAMRDRSLVVRIYPQFAESSRRNDTRRH